MYVYDNMCAVQQIWGCLLDIWVAMCSESHDRQEFDQINLFLYSCICVVMILSKEQIIIVIALQRK